MIARIAFCLSLVALAGCNREIYLRDGVTDGDTFYLAGRALHDDDPVLQSWVSYSLSLGACKVAAGGTNPARVHTFDRERLARGHLADTWREQRTADARQHDAYLDALQAIDAAGWLDEYVVHFHGDRGWQRPDTLDLPAFRAWVALHHPRLEPETRLIGSWNYARNVQPGR